MIDVGWSVLIALGLILLVGAVLELVHRVREWRYRRQLRKVLDRTPRDRDRRDIAQRALWCPSVRPDRQSPVLPDDSAVDLQRLVGGPRLTRT